MLGFIVIILIVIYVIKNTNKVSQQGRNNSTQPYQGNNTYQRPMAEKNPNELSEAQKRYQQRVQEYNKNKNIKNVKADDIINRAKKNTDKLKDDTTLSEIEKMHGHSESYKKEPVEHSSVCQAHDKSNDVINPQENILGSVEDLMVKGYDGNLNFDRDFVGEALDMISDFEIPSMSVNTDI